MWGRPIRRASKPHFCHFQRVVLPPFDEAQKRLFARYLTMTAAGVITLHSSRVFAWTCTVLSQTIEIARIAAALRGFVVATAAVSRSLF